MMKSRSKPKVTPTESVITYAMRLKNGTERKVTVPLHWKVTFGPTVPFERKSHGPDNVWALRFYDGERLRAIFTDVAAFRDTSIQILEKRIRKKRQVLEKNAHSGGRAAVVEATIETWVNPDAPDEAVASDEEFLQLDYDGDDF